MKAHEKTAIRKAVLTVLDGLDVSTQDELSQQQIVEFANKAVRLAQLRAYRTYDLQTQDDAFEYAKSLL